MGVYHSELWWERHPDVDRCTHVKPDGSRCAAVASTGHNHPPKLPRRRED